MLLFLCLLVAFAPTAPALAQSCQTHTGLTYGTYVDANGVTQELKLELLVPMGAAAPTPLVIWIHGGGWSTHDRFSFPASAQNLCQRGYAVASVDYRLVQTARWPAQIQDVKGAVRWLRANAAAYNLDPDRFGAWGESAGGHLATMLATSGGVSVFTVGPETVDLEGTTGGNLGVSSRVQAAVDWYGATDFLWMFFYPTPSAPDHNASNSAESRLVGSPIQQVPERVATANPVTYVTPDDPPILVMHGTQDVLIPFHQSELLVDALRSRGGFVSFSAVQNAGHGGTPWTATAVVQTVYSFFDQVLLAAPAQSVSVTALSPSATEPGTAGTFRISRSDTSSSLVIPYVLGGTAKNGTDYTALASSVTLAAGVASATISVRPVEDALIEGNETVILVLASDPAYRINSSQESATVTLLDNDSPTGLPVVSIAAADANASETGPDQGSFMISRSGSTAASLSVTYSVAGTAAGSDRGALSGSVTIPAGQASVSLPVIPVDDGDLEPTETVLLTLEPSAVYSLGSPATASVRISDNDRDPALPIVAAIAADFDASEPGSNTGSFFLTRTGSTTSPLTVSLGYNGTAQHGMDHSAPLSVTFPAGSYRIPVTVTPTDDLLDEGTETVGLTIPYSSAILVGPSFTTVAVADDEPLMGSLAIVGVTLNPASVESGQNSVGTVTLNGPAPAGGAIVTLSSGNTGVATVPASVTVPAGASTATFTVTVKTVGANSTAGISAYFRTVTRTATLTVKAPVLSGLTLTPSPFIGGCKTSTGRVTLTGKAPTGGIVVQLANTNPVATVPASVTVPAGANSVNFTITAPAVTSQQSGTVTASYAGVSKAGTLAVRPVQILSLALSPNPVVGPAGVTGTVTLECPAAPGDILVTLATSNAAVASPAVGSITIPAGTSSGTFPINTADVSAVSSAAIRATVAGGTKSVTLTVNP